MVVFYAQLGVRAVGFEPTASGLKVRCSTTELRPRSPTSSQSVHRVRPSREGTRRSLALRAFLAPPAGRTVLDPARDGANAILCGGDALVSTRGRGSDAQV